MGANRQHTHTHTSTYLPPPQEGGGRRGQMEECVWCVEREGEEEGKGEGEGEEGECVCAGKRDSTEGGWRNAGHATTHHTPHTTFHIHPHTTHHTPHTTHHTPHTTHHTLHTTHHTPHTTHHTPHSTHHTPHTTHHTVRVCAYISFLSFSVPSSNTLPSTSPAVMLAPPALATRTMVSRQSWGMVPVWGCGGV